MARRTGATQAAGSGQVMMAAFLMCRESNVMMVRRHGRLLCGERMVRTYVASAHATSAV